jgi:hypothetical protein
MRRKKAEITSVYGGDGTKIDSYVSHYGYVNIPRFKHKKKPISMIKALEVGDRIYHKQQRVTIKNELFAKKFTGLGADMKCYVEDIPGGRS